MTDDKDFVVKDRRVFSQEEPETKDGVASELDQSKAEEGASGSDDAPGTEESQTQSQLPEINFSTFVMSLNASALVNLGLIDDPGSGQRVKNLPLSKQTIDILGMLEEKTRGNLAEDEAQMLKSVLYELRMLYIKEME